MEKNYLCTTCHLGISNKRVPNLCLSNGLDFPSQPVCLKSLTTLEERLVAPRLPFMRVVEVGCDRQSQFRGNVVNVPIKLDKTVSVLPREFNDTKIIQI